MVLWKDGALNGYEGERHKRPLNGARVQIVSLPDKESLLQRLRGAKLPYLSPFIYQWTDSSVHSRKVEQAQNYLSNRVLISTPFSSLLNDSGSRPMSR